MLPSTLRAEVTHLDLGEEQGMLVLSRQRDESIMIGDDVKITVVEIRGNKVKLGIEAPTSVKVHRKEIYQAIKRQETADEGDDK